MSDAQTARRRAVVGAVFGGAVLANTWGDIGRPSRAWLVPAVVALAAAVAVVLPPLRRHLPPGWVPALLIGVAAVSFLCVPETDQFFPVGAALLILVGAELTLERRLTAGWHLVAAGVVLWAGVYGATGRESAFIGTLFAWWPVLVLSAIHVLRPRFDGPVRQASIIVVAGVAATVVARTGGLQPTAAPAVTSMLIAGAVSLGIVAAIVTVSGAPGGRAVAKRRPNRV